MLVDALGVEREPGDVEGGVLGEHSRRAASARPTFEALKISVAPVPTTPK